MSKGIDKVKTILKQRAGSHGAFEDNAKIALALRAVFRAAPNWSRLPEAQQLALDEMALKQARLLSAGSDASFAEHWHDIAGYARLGEIHSRK